MSSRAVIVVLLALAVTATANAGQIPTEVLPHHSIALNAQALRPELTLSDLFSNVGEAQPGIHDDGSIDAGVPSVDVVVARVGADGRIVTACFHDEKSARVFLEPKPHTLAVTPQEK